MVSYNWSQECQVPPTSIWVGSTHRHQSCFSLLTRKYNHPIKDSALTRAILPLFKSSCTKAHLQFQMYLQEKASLPPLGLVTCNFLIIISLRSPGWFGTIQPSLAQLLLSYLQLGRVNQAKGCDFTWKWNVTICMGKQTARVAKWLKDRLKGR